MKYLSLLLLNFCLLSWKSIVDDKTKYFPKKTDYVQQVPDKKNVWVFLMAGQSNMAGRGIVEPQDTLPDQRILSIDARGKLIYAKEPLHFYEPSRKGLDCGISFARTLLKNIPDSITLLMLPAAIGGSAIRQWLGDSLYRGVNLLTNFKEKIAIAKQYGQIKAILWHQGESDVAPERAAVYQKNLATLFSIFRSVAGDEQLPIYMGELGSYSTNPKGWLQINQLIHTYAEQDANAAVIPTADLVHVGDTIHFNSAGQRTMGERFAQAFLQKKQNK